MKSHEFTRLFTDNLKWKAVSFGLERTMGEYLRDNPSLLSIKDIVPVFKHFELKCEKLSDKSLGRIDALVFYDDTPAIVELKNDELTPRHSAQLLDYVNGRFPNDDLDGKIPYGVLVGSSVSTDLWVDLKQNKDKYKQMAILTINKYEYENKTYAVVNEVNSFPIKDYSKYSIKWEGGCSDPYVKARLIFMCVSKYLEKMRKDNKFVSFESLEKLVEVQTSSRTSRHPYLLPVGKLESHNYDWAYYKDEPFTLDDGNSFVVFNWLDRSDIPNVEKVVGNLGFELIKAKK